MDWKMGPPVLVGERVVWPGNARNESRTGIVRWMGNIPEISPDWCVGLELDDMLDGGFDGFWKGRKLFECKPHRGLLVPINEIQKLPSRSNSEQTSTGSHSDLKLDGSQLRDFTLSDLKTKSTKKSQETQRKHRFSALESKLTEWTLKNRTADRRNVSGFEIKNKNQDERTRKFEDILDRISAKQQHLLKSKSSDGKLSLKKKRRKRKSFHETDSKRHSKLGEQSFAEESQENLNESFENAPTLDSKAFLRLSKDMNDVAGYFKEIKEDDMRYDKPQTERSEDGIMGYNMADSGPGQGKEKKFFSFLKWFKKNKDEPNIKFGKDSSAASSPMFARRRNSSYESVDTLFSTQTVKSFAYIPPNQYEPSAPPSSLLDFDKSSDENVFEKVEPPKSQPEETESIYDKRKKRKAPPPPRLSRENSLPTTLERKQNEDTDDGNKTYHRRTVSESFKDKKAGAYCHVQGKKKAPLPPPPSLYPNLQKLNNQYPSLSKKKKPAPPPPTAKNSSDIHSSTKQSNIKDSPTQAKNEKLDQKTEPSGAPELNSENEDKKQKIPQSPKEKLTKDVSLSPLPSRPWYKRSHRDSNGSNIIKKDLLKGFEWKKNKETEDWMPEVGFSRRSLSTDSTHNKFNIFSRLEKTEDKKKEEKRKSQISILTNISELDREAAEIVRKEQAEEKKMIAQNDAKYYSAGFPKPSARAESSKISSDRPEVADTSKRDLPLDKKKDERKEDVPNISSDGGWSNEGGAKPKLINNKPDSKTAEDKTKKALPEATEEKYIDKENLSNQSNEKSHQNPNSPKVLADVTNSGSPTPNRVTKPNQSNLNYFKVENKELNYLNEPWVCQKCTLENPGWRVFCEICSSVKPRFLFNPQKANADKPIQPLPKSEVRRSPEPEKSEKYSPPKQPKSPEKSSPIIEKRPAVKECPPEEIPEDKNEPIESLEELRQKRMTFFTTTLDKSVEKTKDEQPLVLKESPVENTDQAKLKKILKDMKNSLPSSEKENRVEEKSEAAAVGEKQEIQVVQNKKSPSKEKITPTATVTDEVKYGAVKKKSIPQPKKEEIAEAYIITKTTVLEDIIIKKADRAPKVSTSVQTTMAEPEPGTSGIRPPPRTKKNVEIPRENSSPLKKKSEDPLDLTPVEEKVLNYTQEDLEELTHKLTQAEGLADFRANIETMAPNTEMNTVAVNRLLRRLETAINCGDHFVAAGLAKELALMNINCSVTRQVANPPASSSNKITIDMYVEDKVSHQGPIPIQVSPAMTLLQLKKKVQQKMGIPTEVQRWILGKKLAIDDSKTLESDGVKTDSCAVFLYLVTPDKRPEPVITAEPEVKPKQPEETPPKASNSPPRGRGWYYNYEEDHYSYCEDSDDDSRDPSPEKAAPKPTNSQSDLNKTPLNETKTPPEDIKPEKPPIVDLKTVEVENQVEKELKLISVNSVKQKVEQLNKTFAENSKPMRINPRSTQSPESWRCVACTFINSPGKFNCSACNAKKVAARFGLPVMGPQIKPQLNKANDKPNVAGSSSFHYKELIELQDADLVPNAEPFNCSICMTDYSPGEGVTLKDCLHTFCRTCLINTVQYSEDAEVKCPYLDDKYSCTSVLQQREIKALVPRGIFERHLAKSVKEAENKIGNAFHCKTPDCKGWCIYEDNVNLFNCPICKYSNCLTCQAIHTGINCREYQERMKDASETDVDAKKTRDMLEEMVVKGEAMACPKCQVVLMKKWGCDWLRCSMCKTEICWVTRGFRWGPGGKGDTSGGCKCGVNGVKCHPKCNYCH